MNRRLLVLAVGMLALGTDSFVVAAVLPGISNAFGVSVGAAGQMASIYSITFALLSPPIAALAATIPRKRLLLCGGIVTRVLRTADMAVKKRDGMTRCRD
jgi:DHA1 family inner membrane transport protein